MHFCMLVCLEGLSQHRSEAGRAAPSGDACAVLHVKRPGERQVKVCAHESSCFLPSGCAQVLIDPPWQEYARRASHVTDEESWTWQQIMALEIENITDTPSFVFLWCAPSWAGALLQAT